MELSDRLLAVASLVTAGYRIADIGTDHAYIPIELVGSGKNPEAVAMDINEGPLKRAEENIRAHGLERKIHIRQSDGFAALKPGEAETAVIAGMGGALMIRILQEGKKVADTLKECILQPQSEINKVRAFLLREGFLFIKENMVKDDGKYYPMMKVIPPAQKGTRKNGQWNPTELLYGKLLLKEKNPVLLEYLKAEIRLKKNILEGLRKQNSQRAAVRCRELEEELKEVEKGIEYYAL